jgi:hypothetical protein
MRVLPSERLLDSPSRLDRWTSSAACDRDECAFSLVQAVARLASPSASRRLHCARLCQR